jgi:hypothetical protein
MVKVVGAMRINAEGLENKFRVRQASFIAHP